MTNPPTLDELRLLIAVPNPGPSDYYAPLERFTVASVPAAIREKAKVFRDNLASVGELVTLPFGVILYCLRSLLEPVEGIQVDSESEVSPSSLEARVRAMGIVEHPVLGEACSSLNSRGWC